MKQGTKECQKVSIESLWDTWLIAEAYRWVLQPYPEVQQQDTLYGVAKNKK